MAAIGPPFWKRKNIVVSLPIVLSTNNSKIVSARAATLLRSKPPHSFIYSFQHVFFYFYLKLPKLPLPLFKTPGYVPKERQKFYVNY